MSSEIIGYTAEEKQVAREAIEYLNEWGISLSWNFNEPPSKKVEEFLFEMASDFFDVGEAECTVVNNAVEQIEMEWLADDEDNE